MSTGRGVPVGNGPVQGAVDMSGLLAAVTVDTEGHFTLHRARACSVEQALAVLQNAMDVLTGSVTEKHHPRSTASDGPYYWTGGRTREP